MRARRGGKRLSGFTGALLSALAATATAQTVVYVSPAGFDTNPGTASQPYRTLSQALSRAESPLEIRMAQGEYSETAGVVLADGRKIVGGLKGPGFRPDFGAATRITFTASGVLPGISARGSSRIEQVTIAGNATSFATNPLYAAEASDFAAFYSCTFEGARRSELHIAGAGSPLVDLCEFTGSVNGIEAAADSQPVIRESHFDGLAGISVFVRGNCTPVISGCVIEHGEGAGLQFTESAAGIVENCMIRRQVSEGVLVSGASPTFRGTIVSLCGNGFSIQGGSTASIENCTVAMNRGSGFVLADSRPDIVQNLITDNEAFGVSEDTVACGGDVRENDFWNNLAGSYLDEDTTPVLELAVLNGGLVNTTGGSGNRAFDPVYLQPGADAFVPAPVSEAVDSLPAPDSSFDRDMEGAPRVVDTVGSGGAGVLDLGAVENQDKLFWGFGALAYDWTLLEQATPIYHGISARRFPGRLRLLSSQTNSFGIANQTNMDGRQPADGVLVARCRFSTPSEDPTLSPSPRIRFNGLSNQLSSSLNLGIRGGFLATPTRDGRDFLSVVDLRQAGLASTSPPPMNHRVSVDLLDFQAPSVVNRVPLDVDEIEVKYVDRAAFEGGFAPVTEWTFDSGPDGWVSVPVAGVFDAAVASYSASRKGLALQNRSGGNCFGRWESPEIPIVPDSTYRFTTTVAANETNSGKIPAFRLSTSTHRFEYYADQVAATTSSSLPELVPTGAGKTYWMYLYIPPDYPGTTPDTLIFDFDLFGFSTNYSLSSLFMLSAKVERRDGPPAEF